MWCGGVLEVQILEVGNLFSPSHQEGNHNVNPFRVTPTGLPRVEPVFIQGMLLYWCNEKSLAIEEISSDQGDQGHSTALRMKSVFSSQKTLFVMDCGGWESKDQPIPNETLPIYSVYQFLINSVSAAQIIGIFSKLFHHLMWEQQVLHLLSL